MIAHLRPLLNSLSIVDIAERRNRETLKPDFCLQKFRTLGRPHDWGGNRDIQPEYFVEHSVTPSFAAAAGMMANTDSDQLATYCLSGMFSGLPGCWLTQSVISLSIIVRLSLRITFKPNTVLHTRSDIPIKWVFQTQVRCFASP